MGQWGMHQGLEPLVPSCMIAPYSDAPPGDGFLVTHSPVPDPSQTPLPHPPPHRYCHSLARKGPGHELG